MTWDTNAFPEKNMWERNTLFKTKYKKDILKFHIYFERKSIWV